MAFPRGFSKNVARGDFSPIKNYKLQNTIAFVLLALLIVVGFSMVTPLEKTEQSQTNTILANK